MFMCVNLETHLTVQSLLDTSEDCLTINVLRPADLVVDKPVPVLAWIFGGGFNRMYL